MILSLRLQLLSEEEFTFSLAVLAEMARFLIITKTLTDSLYDYCTIRANALEVIDSRRVKMVDLVGIEPTTSSMPWKKNSSRRLILKQLTSGTLVRNRYIRRYFRPISGQILNIKTGAAVGGGSCYSRISGSITSRL